MKMGRIEIGDDAAVAALERDVKELRQRVDALEKLARELDGRTVGEIRLGPRC